MKKSIVFLLVAALLNTLYAGAAEDELEVMESQRHKRNGFIMAGLGIVALGGGAGMIYSDLDNNDKLDNASGAMGATTMAGGIGLCVGSFFQFKKSKQIIDELREKESLPLSIYIKTNGIALVGSF